MLLDCNSWCHLGEWSFGAHSFRLGKSCSERATGSPLTVLEQLWLRAQCVPLDFVVILSNPVKV